MSKTVRSKYAKKKAASYVSPKVDHRQKERHGEDFRLHPERYMRTNEDKFGGWSKCTLI